MFCKLVDKEKLRNEIFYPIEGVEYPFEFRPQSTMTIIGVAIFNNFGYMTNIQEFERSFYITIGDIFKWKISL